MILSKKNFTVDSIPTCWKLFAGRTVEKISDKSLQKGANKKQFQVIHLFSATYTGDKNSSEIQGNHLFSAIWSGHPGTNFTPFKTSGAHLVLFLVRHVSFHLANSPGGLGVFVIRVMI